MKLRATPREAGHAGPPQPGSRSGVEQLIELTHDQAVSMSDQEIIGSYDQAREAFIETDGVRVHPNIQRLYATALEREKDRREVRVQGNLKKKSEMQLWYEEAARRPVTWWLKHHLVARRSLKSCMACGTCTAQCPAARTYEDYNPRAIVDAALSEDEERLQALLGSELLWYCGQCGSCKPNCPRENNIMGLISSLRYLAQLKGWHVLSARGRQQYACRHLWGGNFWNRGCSLYFRNITPEAHPDFGPRWARYHGEVEAQMRRVGADPDSSGLFGGRVLARETLEELRSCVVTGGTLVLWNALETAAFEDAQKTGVTIDEYVRLVGSEG